MFDFSKFSAEGGVVLYYACLRDAYDNAMFLPLALAKVGQEV